MRKEKVYGRDGVIMSRRSIRKYKRTPVPEEDLNSVLEAGGWAPSWANTWCWEIIAVTKYGDWFMFDLALAMGNIMLPAHNHGLGTVILGYFDHDAVARILRIPDDLFLVAMMPLGYPDIAPQPPARKLMTACVSYEQYGQRLKPSWGK